MQNNKVFSLLGIAMKGRMLANGEFQTLDAVKSGKARLVVVAEDASDNTKKLFRDKCSFYEVPIYEFGTEEDLGRAIGKGLRSAMAVGDAGLANEIAKQLERK